MMTVPAALHRHVHVSNPTQGQKRMRQNVRKRSPRASLSPLLCRPLAQQQQQQHQQRTKGKKKNVFEFCNCNEGFITPGRQYPPKTSTQKTKQAKHLHFSHRVATASRLPYGPARTSHCILLWLVVFLTMSRPELQTPPELFYNDKMSRKYNSNSRMVGIQAEISDRCIELLNIEVRLLFAACGVGCHLGR